MLGKEGHTYSCVTYMYTALEITQTMQISALSGSSTNRDIVLVCIAGNDRNYSSVKFSVGIWMGITRAEVHLGTYLPEGCDLSLGVIGSVWDAVGVIGFWLDCMVSMMVWLLLCVMILVCISVDIKIGLV